MLGSIDTNASAASPKTPRRLSRIGREGFDSPNEKEFGQKSDQFQNPNDRSQVQNVQKDQNLQKDFKDQRDQGEESSNIKVICRIRPTNANETADKSNILITELQDNNDNTSLAVRGKESGHAHSFTFDRVFGPESTQQDIYSYSIKSTVEDVLSGYNGTILAYGQTGSGKSYTMLGPSIKDDLTKGLIPRISDELFDRIKNGSNNIEYTVSISIMEIYLEQIKDLLVDNNSKLSIHEDRENGIHVKGLSHGFISNTKELYKFIKMGIKNRTSTVTNMNLESSRSHAIFQLKVHQKNMTDDSIKKSNLFLIDLAGSEKVDKTGAIGQTLQEAKNINSSLSALGNVINALTDHKSTHIPYRDSRLTRILQESLGGNSRTTLILNVSPCSLNELETFSTLRFGTRAKSIKNKPLINKELSKNELKFRLKQLERENEQNKLYIQKLENKLRPGEDTVVSSGGSYNAPVTPKRGSDSKIPIFVNSTSPMSPNHRLQMDEKLQEKDEQIKRLQEEVLNYKIQSLRVSNEEELKLNKLERVLNKLSEKLTDVEVININLRKHLMISEKVIEQRDQSIEYLNKILTDQQNNLTNQSINFENRLHFLKNRLQDQQISERTSNLHLQQHNSNSSRSTSSSPTQGHGGSRFHSPSSPMSPKIGLNLNIIKPIMGGSMEDTDDEEEYFNDENINTINSGRLRES